jgi:DNA adenine methylase
LGTCPTFVEPFFGSGAVLFRRPAHGTKRRIETVNDKDGYVANFWRAIKHAPEETAEHADNPVNENDLHARHAWLLARKDNLAAKLEGDPDYYDTKIAGWWAWGMSCWIGSGFCSGQGPWVVDENRKLVHLSGEQGVNRQLVHLRSAGGGVGVCRPNAALLDWFADLAERLENVRVCCGNWDRICGPSPTFQLGLTGVFLDPPYSDINRDDNLYTTDDMDIANEVRVWAIEAGKNPLMRVALCGYEGEHEMPDAWSVYRWHSNGGYGLQGDGKGRANSKREVIWFSPACLKHEQGKML